MSDTTTSEQEEKEVVKIPKPSEKPSANRTVRQFNRTIEILQEMPSVTSVSVHFNISLYGPRGSGKTTLAASIAEILPEARPELFYVDVENSLVSVLNHANPAYKYRNLIKPYKPKDFDEFHQRVQTICEYVDQLPFGAFVIDTVGEVAEDTVSEVLAHNIRTNNRNPYLASEHEYRERNERLRQIFKLLRDSPIHVVLISHEANPEPDRGLGYRPQLSGKMLQMVENNCDMQVRMQGELKGNKFTGVCEVTAGATTNASLKSRIMGLPPKIENPTMAKLLSVTKPTRSTSDD